MKKNADKSHRKDKDTPISWVHEYGKGKVFYCSLGHENSIFWNRAILQHYLDGIQYVMGDLEGVDATPSAKLDSGYFKQSKQNAANTLMTQAKNYLLKYYYGVDRGACAYIEKKIKSAGHDERKLNEIRSVLVYVLNSNGTVDGKNFACLKLGEIGTEKHVPVLVQKMRGETFDAALAAIENLDNDAARTALCDAVAKASGRQKAAIINSLGNCGDTKAVSVIAKSVGNPDNTIRRAVFNALGNIGDSESARQLKKEKRYAVGDDLLFVWSDAYLKCADNIAALSRSSAEKIYNEMLRESKNANIRAAALKGLVLISGSKADNVIIDGLFDADVIVKQAAVRAARVIDDTAVWKTITKKLKGMDDTAKVMAINMLADAGFTGARASVLRQLLTDSPRSGRQFAKPCGPSERLVI